MLEGRVEEVDVPEKVDIIISEPIGFVLVRCAVVKGCQDCHTVTRVRCCVLAFVRVVWPCADRPGRRCTSACWNATSLPGTGS